MFQHQLNTLQGKTGKGPLFIMLSLAERIHVDVGEERAEQPISELSRSMLVAAACHSLEGLLPSDPGSRYNVARTCETLPNESDAATVELAQTVERVGHCGMPRAGGSLEDRAGRVLGVPRDPWHTACAGHHQYTQAWQGPVADSSRPVPPGRRISGRPTPSSPSSLASPLSSTTSTSARPTRGR